MEMGGSATSPFASRRTVPTIHGIEHQEGTRP